MKPGLEYWVIMLATSKYKHSRLALEHDPDLNAARRKLLTDKQKMVKVISIIGALLQGAELACYQLINDRANLYFEYSAFFLDSS